MKLNNPTAEVFVPDGLPLDAALARTTHLSLGAHPDDLEFMSLHGILECFQQPTQWFTGVTVTDGRGSSRTNQYANCTDAEMVQIRKLEQKKAAMIGEYSAVFLLDYSSSAVANPQPRELIDELKAIITACKASTIYTHSLADKHDTHIVVALAVIQALRELPTTLHPKALCGCEGWRNLDWMPDDEKVLFNISGRENLLASLMGVFDSQITGGKRYDLATFGRKRANATYLAPHASDRATMMEYAMDLTPLIQNPTLNIQTYVRGFIDRFAADVATRIGKRLPA